MKLNTAWTECSTCNKKPSGYSVCPFVKSFGLKKNKIEELQCLFLYWLEMSGFVLVSEKGLHQIEPFDILPEELLHKIEIMKRHNFIEEAYDALAQRYENYLFRIRERLIGNSPSTPAARRLLTQRSIPLLTAK